MNFVSCTDPEIADLLGLDIAGLERRAVNRRGWHLQDRQWGSVAGQRLRHSRNGGNEGRQRKCLGNGDHGGQQGQ